MSLSLFDPPDLGPTGPENILPKEGEVFLFQNFFSRQESDELFKSLLSDILWKQEEIRMYGKAIPIPRLTAWYGDGGKAYSYSGIPMVPNPWSSDLLGIKKRVEEKAGTQFNSVLLNLYRTGQDSVAWHCDNEKELGINPVIASVSFGQSRTFKFRNLEDRTLVRKVELSNGSLVVMQGETQHRWEHSVPKTNNNVGNRVNLTFRTIM